MEKKITWFDNAVCRPAKNDILYLVITKSGNLSVLEYNTKWNMWNVTDDSTEYAMDVKFWAVVELPEV